MGDKQKVAEEKISYDGVFDFKDAYSFLYTLFSDWGYGIAEKSYSEKNKGESKDIDVSWEGSRKFDDYFKANVKIDWKVQGLKAAEVMKDGKKEKVQMGKIEVKITGILVKDYEDKWTGTPMLKFMRGIYDKFVNESIADEYEDKLKEEVEESVNQVKAFLVLEAKR